MYVYLLHLYNNSPKPSFWVLGKYDQNRKNNDHFWSTKLVGTL